MTTTIHVQPDGTSRFVGRAVESSWWTDNYYKRMATAAFLETIDRIILETLVEANEGRPVRLVADSSGKPEK